MNNNSKITSPHRILHSEKNAEKTKKQAEKGRFTAFIKSRLERSFDSIINNFKDSYRDELNTNINILKRNITQISSLPRSQKEIFAQRCIEECFVLRDFSTEKQREELDTIESTLLSFASQNIQAPTTPEKIGIEDPKLKLYQIKVGLPNITEKGGFGNTCWLNTTLKFISCTDFYDDMLTQPPPSGMEEALKQLKDIIHLLRTQKEGQVPRDIYKKFLNTLKDSVLRGKLTIGKQEDAPEFLMLLTDQLGWKGPKESPQFGEVYRTKEEGVIKFGKIHPPQSQLNIDLYSYQHSQAKIDLSFQQIGDVEVRADVIPKENDERSNKQFKKETCYTHLPKTLTLNLKRAVQDDYGRQLKINNDLQSDENGYVTLTEYRPVLDESGKNIITMEPAFKCRYRIDAAMTHGGGVGGGHYTCHIRNPSGQVEVHSDERISEGNPITFGKQGYFLCLSLVGEKEPIITQ